MKPKHPKSSQLLVPQHLYEYRISKDGLSTPHDLGIYRSIVPGHFMVWGAWEMTYDEEFIIGPKEDVVIRVFTAESLGVTGWTETAFFGPIGFEHVKKFGLAECLADDFFWIRWWDGEQKPDGWIRVAHKPILSKGRPSVFAFGPINGGGPFVMRHPLSRKRLQSDWPVALRVASSSQNQGR